METYVFSIDSLKLMHSYLVGRRQRVKIGTSFNTSQEIKSGVPRSKLNHVIIKLSIRKSLEELLFGKSAMVMLIILGS